jgi:aspartyl-tRNA(Asn)/glutamyl-tRNA(Gln) amidotransferase subunit A
MAGSTAADVAAAARSGERSITEIVRTALRRAEAADARDQLNIFLSRSGTYAAARAEVLERDAVRRENGALYGVPVAVKDNIAVADQPLTCASRILEGYISPYSATAIEHLEDAGAVLVGKTNLDEFAMGSSTETSAFGPTRNPLAPHRVPGGSSGGSAAAVAAKVVPIALGSETGGSVRQPAAFCGIVGVKPTYGRVSRYGLVAYGSSLDQIGVFATTVADAAVTLRVIAGRDERDPTTADVAAPETPVAPDSLSGVVIGRPREYFPDDLDARIADRCASALERLRERGAEIRDVSLPHTAFAIPAYYIIATAEASSNLARFDGVRYGRRASHADGVDALYEATRARGFGAEVQRRIMLGTYVLSAGYYDAYYRKAMQARSLITQDFHRVFDSGVQALFSPTTPTTAFPLGSRSSPYEMYLSDIFTCPANLAGIPAISVPIGRVDGLPVGGQLMCARFDETRMFAIADALERTLGTDAHR